MWTLWGIFGVGQQKIAPSSEKREENDGLLFIDRSTHADEELGPFAVEIGHAIEEKNLKFKQKKKIANFLTGTPLVVLLFCTSITIEVSREVNEVRR